MQIDPGQQSVRKGKSTQTGWRFLVPLTRQIESIWMQMSGGHLLWQCAHGLGMNTF